MLDVAELAAQRSGSPQRLGCAAGAGSAGGAGRRCGGRGGVSYFKRWPILAMIAVSSSFIPFFVLSFQLS
jgi:hypothetical protein